MNRLAIQSRHVELEEQPGSTEFWTLLVDGVPIASSARPFDAASHEIVLSECAKCAECGRPEVTCRRLGESSVVWYSTLDDMYEPTLERDRIFVFDRIEYERVVGGSAAGLNEFGEIDFEYCVHNVEIPDWRDALYTIPELPSDGRGRSMLRILTSTLTDKKLRLHFSEVKESDSLLRIGVEASGIPETTVHLRFAVDRVYYRFAGNPLLPFWLSHPTFNSEFPALVEGSEIARQLESR